MGNLERRLLWLTSGLTACGILLTWWGFGGRAALSFLAGVGLAATDLVWLRSTMHSIFSSSARSRKSKVLLGFFLRLLLIPLGLYAMIRFLCLDVVAAVAGLGIFICSVLVEGVLEAFGCSPR